MSFAYKQNYVFQKLKLNKDWWKNKDRKKWGFNRSGIELQTQIYSADISKTRGVVSK